MTPERLRTASATELAALSDLMFRSKAHWGYDPDWLDTRRAELTLTAEALRDPLAVIRDGDGFAGIAALHRHDEGWHLDKLFVAPHRIGQGTGRALFGWAVGTARALGAPQLLIDSEPQAEGFYLRMGATRIGAVPSPPPEGRVLPRLALDLTLPGLPDA